MIVQLDAEMSDSRGPHLSLTFQRGALAPYSGLSSAARKAAILLQDNQPQIARPKYTRNSAACCFSPMLKFRTAQNALVVPQSTKQKRTRRKARV